ncbi:MAG: UPF0147 family protein [Nanoarchaeota archaeon]|nr:UPF0147 family protein [Nanoarchaeota archaeon]MBU1269419.1 UPF0147 family protein [Nanoarchaeota archaeon]MBU1603706.1 UPF0147 family protein [Nanoarchaeota archaeon]MBU2442943.1 UPF0147 family protein [Nanoarchaeota archaeon]
MKLQEAICSLEELKEDSMVPKNVKLKISGIIQELKTDKDQSLKVNKSLSDLDEICEDMNIPPFIRTQLWGVTSMLEKIQ